MGLYKYIGVLLTAFLLSLPVSAGLFNITVSKTDETCAGLSDGTATVNFISGGATYPFTYEWYTASPYALIPGETDSTITDLPDGNYWVWVYDDDGFSDFKPFTIAPAFDIQIFNVSHTDVDCNGDNTGTITIIAGGGTGALEYSIYDGAGGTYQSSPIFTGLPQGDYNIKVRDANLCEKTYAGNPEKILEPSAINIDTDAAGRFRMAKLSLAV